MEQSNLEALRARAQQVATKYDERARAFSDQEAAEAELLSAVIEAVRPALRALSCRQPIAESYRSGRDDSQTKLSTERYVCLTDDKLCPSRRDAQFGPRGDYVGRDLLLGADGRFWRATYAGSWSQWDGERSHWEATLTELTPVDVVRECKVENIVEAIGEKLDEQVNGKSEARTKSATERAVKLRALTALL